jgi:hypothetical protein
MRETGRRHMGRHAEVDAFEAWQHRHGAGHAAADGWPARAKLSREGPSPAASPRPTACDAEPRRSPEK